MQSGVDLISQLTEIDHVARFILNADHSIVSYGLGNGIGRGLGVGAHLPVHGVGVGVGVGVAVVVAVAVAVGAAVDVAAAVAVGVEVAIGVAVGVFSTTQTRSEKTWSGDTWFGMHAFFRFQVTQPVP